MPPDHPMRSVRLLGVQGLGVGVGLALGLVVALASGCGPRPADRAPAASAVSAAPAASSVSPAVTASESAAAAVAAYLTDAELQAETDAQRQELRRALTDLLERPPSALATARYAAPDGMPGQRDLAAVLRGHLVPRSPRPLNLEMLLAAQGHPKLAEAVRPHLAALSPAAPASAASR